VILEERQLAHVAGRGANELNIITNNRKSTRWKSYVSVVVSVRYVGSVCVPAIGTECSAYGSIEGIVKLHAVDIVFPAVDIVFHPA
jgi:hypothetical protein